MTGRHLLTSAVASTATSRMVVIMAAVLSAASLVVALLAVPAQAGPADRYQLSLDGSWNFLPHDGAQAGVPGTMPVPAFWDTTATWPDVTHATYSTTFDVPAEWAAHRVILRFAAVSFRAIVSVNGNVFATHDGDGTPFEFDVTDTVVALGNTLSVEVFDQEVVNVGGFYTYPPGLPFRPGSIPAYLGIAQSVSLLALPLVHVDDVHVVTGVAAQTLELRVTVRNDDTVAHLASVENDVLDGGSLVKTFVASAAVSIAAGQQHTFVLSEAWTTALAWWPDRPQLYSLDTRVVESTTALDTKSDTFFGWRELAIVGAEYRLNGSRLNLRGDAHVYPQSLFDTRAQVEAEVQEWKDIGVNIVRYHTQPPPPLFLDVCDEMGLMVVAESSVYCSDENLALFDPVFWANARAHISEWVPRDRNHPSIVEWAVANECLYKNLPAGMTTADLVSLETELRLHEQTLPVIYDGDGAIGGSAATSNKHYPSSVAHLQDLGASHAWTNWYSLDPYWMDGVIFDRPTGVGEWMFNKAPSSSTGSVFYPRSWGRIKAMMIRGYRYNDLADIRPFTIGQEGLNASWRYTWPMFKASFAANAVYDHDYDDLYTGLYAPSALLPALNEGTVSTRTLTVYNEDLSDVLDDQVTVEWRTHILGETIDSGSFTATVSPGAHLQQAIAMPVPEVNQTTVFGLSLNARKAGGLVFEDKRYFRAVDVGGSTVSVPTVLVDNFDAGSPDDAWTMFRPDWQRTGVLSATGTTNEASVAVLDNYKFGDLTFECDLRLVNATGYAGVGIRRSLPEDYRSQGGYSVYLKSSGHVSLYDSDAGAVIAQAQTGVDVTVMHRLRVEAVGSNIKVYVDGVLFLDHTDTVNPITTPGYLGFIKSATSVAEYDTVLLSAGSLSVCGNGVLDAGEDCDDGNTVDGDCCSSLCFFEVAGSLCSDDGNVCTDNLCDGAGACAAINNNAPCDDGLFCNGPDACFGGTCNTHAGDPCAGGTECADSCDEAAGDCNTAADTPCSDDGNVCTDNLCDGAGACATINNNAPCDDGDVCTLGDSCAGGVCVPGGQGSCPSCSICDPGVGCVAAPWQDCLQPTAARKSKIDLRDDGNDAKDRLKWKWTRGQATALAWFGDPVVGDGFSLCIYEGGAGSEEVLLGADLTGGGLCSGKPCWKALGTKGFKYRDKLGSADGIEKVTLKAGAEGKPKISLKGRGANLAAAPLPAVLPVAIQLQADTGWCWQADYDQAGLLDNSTTRFKARSE